jgi:carboxylesterase
MTSPDTSPFFYPGGDRGVLLVHGFLTGPDEMRPLGNALAESGFTVLGIRLAGHGVRVEELAQVSWRDWVRDVQEGLARLRQSCDHVSLAGLSMGAALALYVAAQTSIERLTLYAAPDRRRARLLPPRLLDLITDILPRLPKIGSDVRDPDARRAHFTYDQIPIKGLIQLSHLLRHADDAVEEVAAPTLVVHSRHDHVIPPATAPRLARRLAGPAYLLWIENGGHTVVIDTDREIVFQATRQWLSGEIPAAAQPIHPLPAK